MVAVGLIFGDLVAEYYEDDFHKRNKLIDNLRNKMIIEEDKQFSIDYLDPEKRSIANAVQVFFNDGSCSEDVQIDYPIGHKNRRKDGIPLLEKKFWNNLNTCFDKEKSSDIFKLCLDQESLEAIKVHDFMKLFYKE